MSEKFPKFDAGEEELLLELVELENGDLGLRMSGDEGTQPMLRVGFSDEMRETMQERAVDIARIMLTAGVQVMAEAGFVGESGPEEKAPAPTVH